MRPEMTSSHLAADASRHAAQPSGPQVGSLIPGIMGDGGGVGRPVHVFER